MVGSQVEKYRGLYVGLPVVSLPFRSSSMPNLKTIQQLEQPQQLFTGPREKINNVATQVVLQDLPSSKIIDEERGSNSDGSDKYDSFQIRMTVNDQGFEAKQRGDPTAMLAIKTQHRSQPLQSLSVRKQGSVVSIYKMPGEQNQRGTITNTASFKSGGLDQGFDDSCIVRQQQQPIYFKPQQSSKLSMKRISSQDSHGSLRTNKYLQSLQRTPKFLNNFMVKAPTNFNFRLNQSTQKPAQKVSKPPLAATLKPILKLETLSSHKTAKPFQTESDQHKTLEKSTSQKQLTNKKNKLELLHRQNEIKITLGSSLNPELQYLITTRDQLIAKYISQQRFDRVITSDLHIRGVLYAVQGEFDKAC